MNPTVVFQVAFNQTAISNFRYFNDRGVLVSEVADLTILHEFYHLAGGHPDPIGRNPDGSGRPTDAQQDAATYNFKGVTVEFQNTIAAQLYQDNVQASYHAGFLTSDAMAGNFTQNVSYSLGGQVDAVRLAWDAGSNVMDMTLHGDSRDLMFGLDGVDTLNGGGGSDYLFGGGDEDILAGGAGDDLLVGGDALSGGDGDDSFRASGGADVFDGGAGSDILYLFGARLEFLITRDDATGDVTLEDQAGTEGRITVKSVEKIYFATDNEEYDLGDLVGFWGTPGDDALVEGNARDNLIYGLAGNDLLRGQAGNDVLFAGGGDDVLEGGAGNDLLYGEGGTDTARGGTGDDTFVVDATADMVVELAHEGNDLVYTSVSYALGAGGEVETLSTSFHAGTSAIDLTGNYFDQTIIGNYGNNVIAGGVGSDVLIGLYGDDIYIATGANASVIEDANGGTDIVYTSMTFALGAGSEVETLSTNVHAGTDSIDLTGSNTGQTVVGNYGANLLDGKGGNDLLAGLEGADTFAFTAALGAGNVDTLFDFSVADDTIALDDAIFSAIGGTLDAGEFVIGGGAADANDRIVYNSATGALFYDADGNGGGTAVQFATLATGLALTAGDFAVI